VADIDLHRFKEDLEKVPPKGSNAPPRSISATDLDGNFDKVTVLPSKTDPPEYQVSYREDGVLLSEFKAGLPEGAFAKQFDVCENGQPIQYWFVVWEQEPELNQ
jgi:hypothetical protein